MNPAALEFPTSYFILLTSYFLAPSSIAVDIHTFENIFSETGKKDANFCVRKTIWNYLAQFLKNSSKSVYIRRDR
jgi:hypothetical protein